MERMNHLEMWHDVFVVIGTSAGALVGLLFIVMSIHLDKINERADDNLRATIDGARFNTIIGWQKSLTTTTPPADVAWMNDLIAR
jgi:hypothetical protein